MDRPGEFADAICSACDSPLAKGGCCTNQECGFLFCFQDDPAGWRFNQERKRKPSALSQFKAGCVIANARTGTYRLPGDRGYARARRVRLAVFYCSENDATQSGYCRKARL